MTCSMQRAFSCSYFSYFSLSGTFVCTLPSVCMSALPGGVYWCMFKMSAVVVVLELRVSFICMCMFMCMYVVMCDWFDETFVLFV
ncbi:unnamed protein product [Choristocarpus tenellus]